MDLLPNSHSKIFAIINEDYMKMVSKENEAKGVANIPQNKTFNKTNKGLGKRLRSIVAKMKTSGSNVTMKSKRTTKRFEMITVESTKAEGPANVLNDTTNVSNKKSWIQNRKIFNGNVNDVLWWNPPEDSLPLDFCRDTSLHGLKYIGQANRHMSERIFWFVAFVVGLIVAVILISDVWNKYRNSPIIVSFQPNPITVDQIPFPAVTICNMNKVLKSKAIEYKRKAEENPNDLEAQANIYYLDLVCSATKSFTKIFNFSNNADPIGGVTKGLQIDVKELTKVNEFLRKSSQNCSDMIPLCIWQGKEIDNCSMLFRPIETEFGKCCQFNSLPQSELYKLRNDSRDDENEVKEWRRWNSESSEDDDGILLKGYTGNFPRRQMEAGKSYGLSLLLNPSIDEYWCTTSDSQGFRMATHYPSETPHVTDFGISLRSKSEIFTNVRPEITLVNAAVFGFDLETRQCYKAGEYPLNYFNYYTIRNCVDECIANETFAKCGCKRYFMPREESDNLCGGNVECVEEVKLNMTRFGAKSECRQCLPSCSAVEYFSQTTVTPLQLGIWEFEDGVYYNNINPNVSIVHIFIGQDSTYARVRNELFGSTDLFANTGGLMGLTLGFSGLSLMEVFYFLTLRAWWASKRKVGIHKSITKKLKSGWMKMKAIRVFQNKQAVLNKQAENQDQDIEKVIGSSTYKLHVSPVYNNYSENVPKEVVELSKQSNVEKTLDGAVRHDMNRIPQSTNALNYKNILGDI